MSRVRASSKQHEVSRAKLMRKGFGPIPKSRRSHRLHPENRGAKSWKLPLSMERLSEYNEAARKNGAHPVVSGKKTQPTLTIRFPLL